MFYVANDVVLSGRVTCPYSRYDVHVIITLNMMMNSRNLPRDHNYKTHSVGQKHVGVVTGRRQDYGTV